MAGGGPADASLVARTMDVLGAFGDRHRRLALTELARRAGLPPPTALRIVRQLIAYGALTRAADGTYAVGRRMWDIGLLAPIETDLKDVAAPFLHDLYAATRATVHIAVRDDDRALYLDVLAGSVSVPVVSRAGSLLPLYTTGVGKVLLADAPWDVVHRVLASLTRITPYTITSPGLLQRQLESCRHDGYATTSEEMTLGACSVAVPVRAERRVVAAIGVVVPSFDRDSRRLTSGLQVAAQGISRELARRQAYG